MRGKWKEKKIEKNIINKFKINNLFFSCFFKFTTFFFLSYCNLNTKKYFFSICSSFLCFLGTKYLVKVLKIDLCRLEVLVGIYGVLLHQYLPNILVSKWFRMKLMVKTRSNHWSYEARVMGWSHKSIMLGEELLNVIIPLLNPDMDYPNNDS